ncbi:MAG: glycosyltransferase family 39 protein [Bacteroidota bacterium]
MTIQRLKAHGFFLFVFIISAILRLLPLFDYQFTYDELSALERTEFSGFSELLKNGISIDAHPALLQVFLFYVVKFFGYKAWLIKLPFIFCSLGGLWYGYRLALNNFSKSTAQLFVSFLAFSLIFVFYAPVARMYGCGVFFSLALLYHFFEIVRAQQNNNKHFALLFLFALLSALNHHMNALFAATVLGGGFVLVPSNIRKKYLLTLVCTLLAYSPHLPVTLQQLGLGGIGIAQNGWLDKPYWDAFYTFAKVLMGTGYLFYLFSLLVLMVLLKDKKLNLSKTQWFLLIVFIVNYAIIYGYSMLRAPIFQNSVMLFGGTAILLFFCSLLQNLQGIKHRLALFGITALLLFQTYVQKDFFHEAVQNNYAYEFEQSKKLNNTYGSQNVAAAFFDADPFMKKLYVQQFGDITCYISTDSVCQSYKAFSNFVKNSACNYLVLGAAMPQFQAIAKNYFPYLIDCKQAQNIHYSLYSKLKPTQEAQNPDSVLFESQFTHRAPFDYVIEQSVVFKSQNLPLRIDSMNEFPFACKSFYHMVLPEEGQMLLVRCKYKNGQKPNNIQTCIAVHNANNHQSMAYNATSAADFLMEADSSTTVYTPYYAGSNHRNIDAQASLAVYLWNDKKTRASLVDFDIQGIAYWQRRWHFWD